MTKVTKTFDHRKYQLVDSGYSTFNAKYVARDLRSKGYNVRSVRTPDGKITLYRRHKYSQA